MKHTTDKVTAPRSNAEITRVAGPEPHRGCETPTAWSPISPSFSPLRVLLPTALCDVLQDEPKVMQSIFNQDTDHHKNQSKNKSFKNDPAVVMAASHFDSKSELDRDMMGMLANNWNLTGPTRGPAGSWGFEPTVDEAQALYDSVELIVDRENNQQSLTGSELTQVMDLAMANNVQMNQSIGHTTLQNPVVHPFTEMESGFAMPYQDCATLPVSDFPRYGPASTSLYMPTFHSVSSSSSGPDTTAMHQYTGPHVVNNPLVEGSVPFFSSGSTDEFPAMVSSDPSSSFHGSNPNSLFNGITQPPAAAMVAINAEFALTDLATLREDDDANSDWNGSSSGFSSISSSPIANGGVPTTSSLSVTTSLTSSTTLVDANTISKYDTTIQKKPKRIRRLCSVTGCGKRARSQDLCIAHGGGRRCVVEGCEKSSQGGNMCIKHGGGKRCRHPDCGKAAQTNSLCKAHGGGPRCQFRGCTKSSQGGGFCRAHGGGKRCAAEGCNKGTQRGDFCALHGGSRFCEVSNCMRNDRGGGFCAHHGGGKRCRMANCNRSCRRHGLCSTHLRLLGQESGGKAVIVTPASASVPAATTGVSSA
ncbi:hypothetical protein BBO99_00008542 [Phytophthora kernoviae]|uniref:WRKY19-like zinc finger domain-containing protein n=2 Tax=Phytophthora kernoviae TaxID=325452 RepID=A0A3R7JQC5_9STRA|nr:hypothetical protein G195_010118 [Phytophthora kernoviae 00238/432]KAG2510697.1 hypothetical protein JM16_008461 [Phytophthora kernoviae]KAG2513465.1 hypothetical protein JM18_008227 [Phytophthora kernoviae]RLM95702.1 hypothetical protein BBI17_008491 [Phytophthora kernoviae]RLN75102.1 hypothetical protein BBO99_00008542 [Phytophthora kernoviae]